MYERQIVLPGVGQNGQDKLNGARVLVVGLGGLGCPVSVYLASAGIGTLGIMDFDVVDKSNLHRQFLYSHEDIGQPKVEIARAKLKSLKPDLAIHLYPGGLQLDNARQVIDDYDLVIDCSDNFPTRYLINDAAYFSGKPVVHGSIYQFEGQVTVFDTASGGPCYRCLFPDYPAPEAAPNCAEAGVFGSLCGIIGSTQANEAIKWILKNGNSLSGKLQFIDSLTGDTQQLNYNRDPDCPLCGNNPSITNLDDTNYQSVCSDPSSLAVDPKDALEWLKSLQATWIDIREDHERSISHIKDSVHLPLRSLQENPETLPNDKHLVLYCHHGARSMAAAQYLRKHGYSKAFSLKGGIHAWSTQIDSSVPLY